MNDCTPPVPAPLVRRGRAAGWVIAVAALYLAALWYVDRDRNILSRLVDLAAPLIACAFMVLAGYTLRYQRWRSILAAQGYVLASWPRSFVAYLAGFAFTASPGKAGELLRIRYFQRQGVAARATLTAFIFERAIDLLVITLLAVGAAALVPMFGVLALVVLGVLLTLVALGSWPLLAQGMRKAADLAPLPLLRRLGHFLIDGASAITPLLRRTTLVPGIALGSLAWGLTAAAFTLLCHSIGIELPWHLALGIYPLAMLIGALSFIPGGVGTTEAAIVLMLHATGAATDAALTVAIGIRLVSLWLAVLVGMLSMAGLELEPHPRSEA